MLMISQDPLDGCNSFGVDSGRKTIRVIREEGGKVEGGL
jgi:hypothetical protein